MEMQQINYSKLDSSAFIALADYYSTHKNLKEKPEVVKALSEMEKYSANHVNSRGENSRILVYSQAANTPNIMSVYMQNAKFTGVILDENHKPLNLLSQKSKINHITKQDLLNSNDTKYAGLLMGFTENANDIGVSELSELLLPDAKIVQLFDFQNAGSKFSVNVYKNLPDIIPINEEYEFLK